MALVSHNAIRKLGVRPSSGNWILTHAQVQAKENKRTLDYLLSHRLNDWDRLCSEVIKKEVPAKDLGDGKCQYKLTGHSQWNRKGYPFVRCTCKRSQGAKQECKLLTNDEYKRYIKIANERWDRRDQLTKKRGRKEFQYTEKKT